MLSLRWSDDFLRGSDSMLIEDYEMDLFCPPCDPGSESWVATVKVKADLSPVMPYVNSVKKNAYYDSSLPTIVWKEGYHKFFIRKNELGINNLHDRSHAERKVKKLIEWLNDLWGRRDEIEPSFETRKPPPVLTILKFLPRTNCGKCGEPSCMAFAAKISEGDLTLDKCPPLFEDEMAENLGKLRELGL